MNIIFNLLKEIIMKKLVLLPIIIFLLVSCEGIFDSGPDLPGTTTNGNDTFGCKIDGKVFVPKFHDVWAGDQALFRYIYKNTITISAFNQDWNNGNSDCESSDVEVIFYSDSTDAISMAKITFRKCNKSYQKAKYKVYEGKMTSDFSEENYFEILRYDTVGTDIILSVTFRGNVYAPNGDLKKITKGRFDVKFSK
jgi:hypothetical protein